MASFISWKLSQLTFHSIKTQHEHDTSAQYSPHWPALCLSFHVTPVWSGGNLMPRRHIWWTHAMLLVTSLTDIIQNGSLLILETFLNKFCASVHIFPAETSMYRWACLFSHTASTPCPWDWCLPSPGNYNIMLVVARFKFLLTRRSRWVAVRRSLGGTELSVSEVEQSIAWAQNSHCKILKVAERATAGSGISTHSSVFLPDMVFCWHSAMTGGVDWGPRPEMCTMDRTPIKLHYRLTPISINKPWYKPLQQPFAMVTK